MKFQRALRVLSKWPMSVVRGIVVLAGHGSHWHPLCQVLLYGGQRLFRQSRGSADPFPLCPCPL